MRIKIPTIAPCLQNGANLIYEPSYNPSQTSRFTLKANDLFWRVYTAAKWNAFIAHLQRKSREMILLADMTNHARIECIEILERQAIGIADIHGSEGRVDEYDCEFYPRQRRDKQRWVGVCVAMMKDRTQLPPVEIMQFAGRYYVKDGHHRVSVAKALGHIFVDADIAVWKIKDSG